MSNANGKRALEDLDSTPGNSKRLNMDTDTDVVITHVSSQPQKGKINVSPSIARNPNKYFGAGSHKRNLQETIESISNEPRTPTRSPKSSQKHLSKYSPFKKSPSKSPRKELFPRAIEDQDSDTYLNFYDRTFEKVVLVSVIQMKEWQENNQLEDHLIDLNTLEKFCTLSQSAKTLYVRLVNRKHAWLKTNALEEKYGKNGADIVADLYTMKDAGVIENNYENEDLSDLLNLLQVHELKDFCKELKLSCSPRKAELVESILKFVKTQRSIMFGGDIQSRVKKLIKKYLGDCVKLSDEARDVFLSCVFLVTFPFYRELSDHVTRLNDYISRIVRTVRGEIKFPAVTLNRTCVFKNRRSFEQYMKAHELCTEIETACKLKSNQAVELLKTALDLLKEDLNDETAMADIGNRPIYLRRYSSGYMYVKILYAKLNDIKRENRNLAVEVLTTLVNQNYFKEYEKGVWFESLAQVYQIQFKNNHKAADTILQALRTLEQQRLSKLTAEEARLEQISGRVKLKDLGWIKHALLERAKTLISRQKGRIYTHKAEALNTWLKDVDELLTIKTVTLSGKLMPNTSKGMKQIYVSESADGTRNYASVEDQARAHFAQQGYLGSRHDEGSTLRSILYALLWDIIYSPPEGSEIYGVFMSPYQEAPLDWRTPNFYERRKTHITKRLQEIKEMSPEQIIGEVMQVEEAHVNESCVINWSCISRDNIKLLTNYLSCIGVSLFVQIGEHIIKDVDHNAKGFPDLIVWNIAKKQCIFVEVKSLNDRLSINQKLWLHLLTTWGANACVAHLKPTGSHGKEDDCAVLEAM